jgi:hypothetical protein
MRVMHAVLAELAFSAEILLLVLIIFVTILRRRIFYPADGRAFMAQALDLSSCVAPHVGGSHYSQPVAPLSSFQHPGPGLLTAACSCARGEKGEP